MIVIIILFVTLIKKHNSYCIFIVVHLAFVVASYTAVEDFAVLQNS